MFAATAYLSSLDPQPAGKWSVVQGDFFELQDTFGKHIPYGENVFILRLY